MIAKLHTENAGFPAADHALIDLLAEIAVQSFFENQNQQPTESKNSVTPNKPAQRNKKRIANISKPLV